MRRKVATWLQEEGYNEFVMGLHWISLHSKGLYKFKVIAKVSAKGVCSEIFQSKGLYKFKVIAKVSAKGVCSEIFQ
jgi:hypothetical protein